MLRNRCASTRPTAISTVLNEVLSLNAQEYGIVVNADAELYVLNEVLSLNAQEYAEQRMNSAAPSSPQ